MYGHSHILVLLMLAVAASADDGYGPAISIRREPPTPKLSKPRNWGSTRRSRKQGPRVRAASNSQGASKRCTRHRTSCSVALTVTVAIRLRVDDEEGAHRTAQPDLLQSSPPGRCQRAVNHDRPNSSASSTRLTCALRSRRAGCATRNQSTTSTSA